VRSGDKDKQEQSSGKGETKDVREAAEHIREAQESEGDDVRVDPKKTGNKPRFDRDR
jgi:hypothetical protein